MVLFVDHFVKNTVVQASVEPVVPGVLADEEDGQVEGDLVPRWEGHREGHADFLCDWVEKPDGEGLHHEMRNQHRLETLPLLLIAWDLSLLDLVFVEVRNTVDDSPGQTTTKVHDFVHHEKEKTSGKHVVIDPVVVGSP